MYLYILWLLTCVLLITVDGYQPGAPYGTFPVGAAVQSQPQQGNYLHVNHAAPSVIVIAGCPACRVSFSKFIIIIKINIVLTIFSKMLRPQEDCRACTCH